MSADALAVGNKLRAIASNTPSVVSSTSAMTDTNKIYVLSTDRKWYYHNGSAWVAGGEYGAVATDITLTQSGIPADAKKTGDQITELKSGLTNITGNSAIPMIAGKYINLSGTTADVNNPSTQGATPTRYAAVACQEGDAFTVSANGGYSPRAWGFVAQDGTILTVSPESYQTTNEILIAPNGAVWLVINDTSFTKTSYIGKMLATTVESIGDTTEELTKEVANIIITGKNKFNQQWNNGGFINQNTGAVNEHSSYHYSDYIHINPSTNYYISYGGGSGLRWAVYGNDRGYLSGGTSRSVSVPNNGYYIRFSLTTASTRVQLEEGTSATAYEPYYQTLNPIYAPVESLDDLIVNLPSKIYALSGYELNIYFENIVEDWTKYKWDVSCAKGKQMERGYQIAPNDSDAGSYTLTITIKISNTVSKAVSTTLIIVPSTAGNGIIKSVIILGDSTTDSGIAVTKLNENFSDDVMNITTLGTRGSAPNNEEGRSGWTFNDYFTKASSDGGTVLNPFYNPSTQTFDATYYFDNSGIAKPDWFFINLGINDMFGYSTDTSLMSGIETAINLCDSMIESIKSASLNTKIGLCITIPPNNSQDAFGKAYGCNYKRYRYKRNNTIWANRIIEEYDGKESDSIYVVPINTNLDTIYNMGLEEIPVNARNTMTYESPIGNGGVHPVQSGYWQIADVYTAFLKANA